MWSRVARLLRAVIGDDGTGVVWPRLTPEGQEVIRLAFAEARDLGHPCMADEHVLLGLLRHGNSQAAALLHARGLDLEAAHAGLRRVGPVLGPGASPAGALQTLGIDAGEIRQRMEASFGTDAVEAAERRVRRRSRWRGGHPRPDPLCVYILAKRALEIAARCPVRGPTRRRWDRAPASALWRAARCPRPAGNPAQPPQPQAAGPARLCPRTAQPGPAPAPGTRHRPQPAHRRPSRHAVTGQPGRPRLTLQAEPLGRDVCKAGSRSA